MKFNISDAVIFSGIILGCIVFLVGIIYIGKFMIEVWQFLSKISP